MREKIMSEEINEQAVMEAGMESVSEVETVETSVNPTEEKARAKGWRPQEEFDGNPEDFVSAKEYIRVGEIIDRTKNVERMLNAVSKQNQEMYKKFQDAEIQGYKRAVEELKLNRQAALDVGDSVQADQITEQMTAYKDTITQEEQKLKQNQIPQETLEFLQRNKDWFGVDQKLTRLTILKEEELRLNHPEKSQSEILEMVEVEMSPHSKKAGKPTPRPLATPNRSSESPARTKHSISDLSRDEKDVYNGIKQADPTYTVDAYIQQLKDIGAR
jgi:hypothetical protein